MRSVVPVAPWLLPSFPLSPAPLAIGPPPFTAAEGGAPPGSFPFLKPVTTRPPPFSPPPTPCMAPMLAMPAPTPPDMTKWGETANW